MTQRILVVDDDENTREALSNLLRAVGYEVDTSEDGPRALECLEAKRYDVLVTDQVMGEMTGLELIERSRERRADQRCIVISGLAAPPAAESARVPWLRKPLDVDLLLDALERT